MENVMDDMMRNLNYVVIILIVSAGMLAFVVLYNLANINISERIRELASLKVLGFYDKEVYDYVTRETAILTAIGIIFGLIGGYFLSIFIVKTCEIKCFKVWSRNKAAKLYIFSSNNGNIYSNSKYSNIFCFEENWYDWEFEKYRIEW